MSLQRRMTWLLFAFVGFTLTATFGTIYVTRLRIDDAANSLQQSMNEAAMIDRARMDAREQYVVLREVVDGLREADETYRSQRDYFFGRLGQIATYTIDAGRVGDINGLRALNTELRSAIDQCLVLARDGDREAARSVLQRDVQERLLPELESRLRAARVLLDESRGRAVDDLMATNNQVLLFALIVGVFGFAVMTIGAALVRRWIIAPIRDLHEAAQQFRLGNLGYRLRMKSGDELGTLGRALDRMAESLAEVRADLEASEAKHRSLFANLRDAVVISDAEGRIVEAHDGDTHLLSQIGPDCAGRRLEDAWPQWRTAKYAWGSLLEHVLATGSQVRATDQTFASVAADDPAFIDMIVYPVEIEQKQHVAIVLRDVTKRKRAEEALRESEQRYRELTDDLRRVMQQLQGVREDERTRIARELHDELGQTLTALNMDLHWLKGRSWPEPEVARERLTSMCDVLNKTLDSVRRICADLRPSLLDEFGLNAAIEWQAREFQNRAGIRCSASLPSTEPALSRDQTTAVFRIFQESLTNVARHARATEVDVLLDVQSDRLILTVSDNGVGINSSDTVGRNSTGLVGMRERALTWGGHVELTGAPGEGASVVLEMPIQPAGVPADL